jgi:hypothetical protein
MGIETLGGGEGGRVILVVARVEHDGGNDF